MKNIEEAQKFYYREWLHLIKGKIFIQKMTAMFSPSTNAIPSLQFSTG